MSFIQSFSTVISSVLVGTIIYAITKFILDNILQQWKIISDISNSLLYYANVYSNYMNNDDSYKKASTKFRELAAALTANINVIPLYFLIEKLSFRKAKVIYTKATLDIVITELIGLSNGCLGLITHKDPEFKGIENNYDRVGEIKRMLNISFPG